jgi:secreted PhoX family phosphatase
MNHESALVDPNTMIAYLSEDRSDSCLYRFVPTHRNDPFKGKLQAMRVVGHAGLDTHRAMPKAKQLRVDWVDIDSPNPTDDSVRKQAHAKGAAKVRRGEGLALHQGTLYLVATTGGKAGVGQIFALTTQAKEQTFSLVCESPGEDALDCPDNLTVTPWSDILIAEDGSGDQFLRGITPDGRVYDIARNAAGRGELAGVCLSPNGRTLFVNMQREGLTLAVSGDLKAVRSSARPMT